MAFPLLRLAGRDPVRTYQVEANGQPATLLCTLRAETDSQICLQKPSGNFPIMSMLSNGHV